MISLSSPSAAASTAERDRRRATPASGIQSRTRTPLRVPRASLAREASERRAGQYAWPGGSRHRRGARVSRHSRVLEGLERRGDSGAALDVRTQLGENELDRRECRRDVEDVEPADVAEAEHFPLQTALAVRNRHAKVPADA